MRGGEAPRKTRILCVDDDPATNRIHAIVLGGQPDMDVVGAASRAEEVLSAIEQFQPDVVLLDTSCAGPVARTCCGRSKRPSLGRVIVVSGFELRELPQGLAPSAPRAS
jgi:chemotaxis response regulator CheB